MDIIGNGVDIIKNSRINNSLKIKGFLNRIFTKNEIKQGKKLKNKINFYAKRFAAKGKVVMAQANKRHGMIKRSNSQIRKQRGTTIMSKQDSKIVKSYMPYSLRG